jgi:hypothetical protein
LFEGSDASVEAQVTALRGVESDPWEELRTLQASLPGRVRWDGQEAPLVRPGRRVAYVSEPTAESWSPLAERIVEIMCSPS